MPSENECSEFLMNEMFRDKDIALVGNSSAMFGKQWPIDEHELVVRMNRAWDLNDEQKKSVGSRIDVLMASTEKRCIQAAAKKSSWVVWMTPKHRDELPTVSNMCYYPIQNWESLFNKIGARPSTGCMSCHLISRHIGGGCLTLYGFDFFSTPSWWISPR